MSTASTAKPRRSSLRAVGGATLIGSFIEWYDFYIFGIASALVFNVLFFPSFDPVAGTLLSFATFATAWVVRPIGGLIFGFLGDRIGRKRTLVITFVMMGVATVAVGLLPTFEQIGVWAPLLLVSLRILQGLSAGGEWSGAATMATEHAPAGKRGLFGAFPQMGIPLALITSNGISLFAYLVPEEALMTWGWRIPFLASIVIIPVGYYIRNRLLESPEFVQVTEQKEVVKNPIVEVVMLYWRPILVVFFIMGGINAFFFTFTTYSLSYATTVVGFTRQETLLVLVLVAAVHAVSTLFFGWFSDRVGRRPIFIAGLLFLVVAPFPLFALINTGNFLLFFLGMAIGFGIGHASLWGISAAFFTELFPPSVRYSGSSIGYQFSGTFFGGPIPLIASALVIAGNGTPWLVAVLVSGVAAMGAVAAVLSKKIDPREHETAQRELEVEAV